MTGEVRVIDIKSENAIKASHLELQWKMHHRVTERSAAVANISVTVRAGGKKWQVISMPGMAGKGRPAK